ncbi:hypothetical protein TrispH2_009150 [Trichoplax sp. H2]|nr:hypothetical protein TrispH2_009150 [Trichoplax sp. H2]|eukprot:RDD37955.1 hypothetical protein TrispH2_009150 [Trichoplax sp. H2]
MFEKRLQAMMAIALQWTAHNHSICHTTFHHPSYITPTKLAVERQGYNACTVLRYSIQYEIVFRSCRRASIRSCRFGSVCSPVKGVAFEISILPHTLKIVDRNSYKNIESSRSAIARSNHTKSCHYWHNSDLHFTFAIPISTISKLKFYAMIACRGIFGTDSDCTAFIVHRYVIHAGLNVSQAGNIRSEPRAAAAGARIENYSNPRKKSSLQNHLIWKVQLCQRSLASFITIGSVLFNNGCTSIIVNSVSIFHRHVIHAGLNISQAGNIRSEPRIEDYSNSRKEIESAKSSYLEGI